MQLYMVAVPSAPLMVYWAPPSPLIRVWITDWDTIYVIVLVYPFAFQCTIPLGLVHEEGFLGDRSAPSHSKACQPLLWPAMLIIWVFFMLLWLIYTPVGWFLLRCLGSEPLPPNSRYGVTLGGTTVIHLMFAIGSNWYFLQALRKQSRSS